MNLIFFHWLNDLAFRGAFLDAVFVFMAEWLPYLIFASLPLLFFSGHSRLSVAEKISAAVLAAVFSWILALIIKTLFPFPRPFEVLSGITPLFVHGDLGASFPSRHTAVVFGLAFSLLFSKERVALIYLVLAAAVGLSRVVAGVHWPIDIVGGFLTGLVAAFFTNKLFSSSLVLKIGRFFLESKN